MSWFKTDAYLIVLDRNANPPTGELKEFLRANDIPAHVLLVDGPYTAVEVICLKR